jgi:hypothetical protein
MVINKREEIKKKKKGRGYLSSERVMFIYNDSLCNLSQLYFTINHHIRQQSQRIVTSHDYLKIRTADMNLRTSSELSEGGCEIWGYVSALRAPRRAYDYGSLL